MRSVSSILLALGLSFTSLQAEIWDGLDFGMDESAAGRKLRNNASFILPQDASVKQNLAGAARLAQECARQSWTPVFEFNKRKLSRIVVEGSAGVEPELFSTSLRSYYLYVLEEIKPLYGLGTPINFPAFSGAAQLKKGEFYPLHSLRSANKLFTVGLRLSKADNLIHVCYVIEPADDSAMGSTGAANTRGSEAEWQNLEHWQNFAEGKRFLGMDEEPLPEPPDEGEDGEDGNESEEEPQPAPEPDDVDEPDAPVVEEPTAPEVDETVESGPIEIDESLSDDSRELLKAIIALQAGKEREGLTGLVSEARKGYGRAFYHLALCYENGRGIAADEERAAKAMQQAAELGYALAMVRFAPEYSLAAQKLGLTKEETKSLHQIMNEGVEQGCVAARFNKAIMLRFGYGLRKDVQEAHRILLRLATQGDPEAARLLKEDGVSFK